MNDAAARLLTEALQLTDAEREELADRLYESLEPNGPDDAAYAEELRRRIEEMDSGNVAPVPWSEVHRHLMEDIDGAAR
jgi:putative addiction module component (TIGR02574 family)